MEDKNKALWEKAAAFHGHVCGGLAIGYQASLYAMELLGLERAEDEEVVCVSENDACGVDAIQAILGCTVGKGNLLFRLHGKQAFTFYRRAGGRAVRLVLRHTPELPRDQRREWLMNGDFHEMFDVKEARTPEPERARIFKSYPCSVCGEWAAENHIHLRDGAYCCEACCDVYTRNL